MEECLKYSFSEWITEGGILIVPHRDAAPEFMPSLQGPRERLWSSLRLVCQSQLPLVVGSNLSAAEPFSISEHWKAADPQSRPPHALVSAHTNSWIKCRLCFSTACRRPMECLRPRSLLMSSCYSSDGESVMSSLRSACQGRLLWVPVPVQSPEP